MPVDSISSANPIMRPSATHSRSGPQASQPGSVAPWHRKGDEARSRIRPPKKVIGTCLKTSATAFRRAGWYLEFGPRRADRDRHDYGRREKDPDPSRLREHADHHERQDESDRGECLCHHGSDCTTGTWE